jgi:FtsP/CotA-like multicopper oxidase with cupredoxin domain
VPNAKEGLRAAVLTGFVVLACTRGDASLPLALANDNRVPAGTLAGDTLRVSLVASMARFYPESDSGPFFTTAAFAEPGEAPLVPGPLIRLRVGTTLRAAVRNTLADTLLVVGLAGPTFGAADTLRIPPNASDSVETLVRTPGTFAYYGHTLSGGKINPGGPGDQLVGALVVDTTATPNDRVFVIKDWTPDSVRFVLMFNGKSWPYTERLTVDVDDTLRVRLINGADSDHPMHLHGFYYTVNARGGWHADTVLAASERRLVVTETLRPRQTMALTWVPTRPGNWLFHCHDAFHINGTQHDYLAGRDPDTKPSSHDAMEHLRQDMAGLVLGITVRGEATAMAAASTDRRMRLFVRERARATNDSLAAYTYALGSDASPHVWPPATLTLTRGQRTAITVINRLTVPTGVHWHGIELESYYDGVAGWSGGGTRLAPLISPNDSFVAVMTPPRAGTFIYHAHVDDELQIGLGLAAPLLVLEPGARRDTTRDHVWLFTVAGITDSTPVVLNGAHQLAPFAAGVPHRIRIVSISPADVIELELRDAAGVVRWRPVAKDGADLPANQSTERSARLTMGPGETWDLIWVPKRGRYSLKVDTFNKFEVPIEARE